MLTTHKKAVEILYFVRFYLELFGEKLTKRLCKKKKKKYLYPESVTRWFLYGTNVRMKEKQNKSLDLKYNTIVHTMRTVYNFRFFNSNGCLVTTKSQSVLVFTLSLSLFLLKSLVCSLFCRNFASKTHIYFNALAFKGLNEKFSDESFAIAI